MKINIYFKKIIRSAIGIYALLFYKRKVEVTPCDILYISAWMGDIDRAEKLSKSLEDDNFHIHKLEMASNLRIALNT